MTYLLECQNLRAGYHGHPVVRDLNLTVAAGEVVVLLGPNGAGKTTTLLTLAGAISVIGGSVLSDGRPVARQLHERAQAGLAFITEERSVFMGMTVADNLRVARCDEAFALQLFPELEPLRSRKVGLLSGGEQQILTVARALARRPRLILADELSLGLAPLVVERLLNALGEAARSEGIGVLFVEQHVRHALALADRAYVMRRGEVILEGSAEMVGERLPTLAEAYLSGGLAVDGNAS